MRAAALVVAPPASLCRRTHPGCSLVLLATLTPGAALVAPTCASPSNVPTRSYAHSTRAPEPKCWPSHPASTARVARRRRRADLPRQPLASPPLPHPLRLSRTESSTMDGAHPLAARERWGFPSDLGGFSLNTCICVYLSVFE